MKNNSLQDYHATMFDTIQPKCNKRIHRLSGILLKTLEALGKLPHTNHLRVKYLSEQCNNIFLDETQRLIKSPQDSDKQKSCYSSKKTHNLKNELLYTTKKLIFWLSQTYDGSIHNKKTLEEQPLSFPLGTTLWQDTCFIGHKRENVTIKMPTKKPINRHTKELKQENIKSPYPFRTCHRRNQKISYCQRAIHMLQV